MTSYGVYLQATGTFVDNNLIRGGCSPHVAGIYTDNAFARIQNNRVFGYTADATAARAAAPRRSSRPGACRCSSTPGLNELDVHSNDIDGGGTLGGMCTELRHPARRRRAPARRGSSGIFRNNILRAGVCALARYGFDEAAAGADPRIFEHNDLDPFMTPTALYFDEGANALTAAAGGRRAHRHDGERDPLGRPDVRQLSRPTSTSWPARCATPRARPRASPRPTWMASRAARCPTSAPTSSDCDLGCAPRAARHSPVQLAASASVRAFSGTPLRTPPSPPPRRCARLAPGAGPAPR